MSNQEALNGNMIIYEDGKIYLSKTQQPLQFNFAKGRVKKLMEDVEANRIQTIYYSTTSSY